MFFRERATQAEYFDCPTRSPDDVALAFAELARINRIFRFAAPFQRLIPDSLGLERCRSLNILDLGAGDGSLGQTLAKWANQRGWRWQVTNLDTNPLALRLGRQTGNVAASAAALPFVDRSFDVVIANQMTHHFFTDDDVCRHFREAWRVANELLLLCDLHRSIALYCVLGAVLHLLRFSREIRQDGLLSIRRGWRVREWRRLAARAGIPNPRVSLYFGARIFLQARRRAEVRLKALSQAEIVKAEAFAPFVPAG